MLTQQPQERTRRRRDPQIQVFWPRKNSRRHRKRRTQGEVDACFPSEPCARSEVAADLRPEKDGDHLVKLKVVAGLIGVDLDELRKRDVMAERRRRQNATGIRQSCRFLRVQRLVRLGGKLGKTNVAEDDTPREGAARRSIGISNRIANIVDEKTSELPISGAHALERRDRLQSRTDRSSRCGQLRCPCPLPRGHTRSADTGSRMQDAGSAIRVMSRGHRPREDTILSDRDRSCPRSRGQDSKIWGHSISRDPQDLGTQYLGKIWGHNT